MLIEYVSIRAYNCLRLFSASGLPLALIEYGLPPRRSLHGVRFLGVSRMAMRCSSVARRRSMSVRRSC
jgi:hypothetical protein